VDHDSAATTDPDTAVFDVDGTLVDSNYHHTLAWFRAFRRYRITLPLWRLHRAIGMGGDQLVAAVAGEDVESRLGDDLRQAWVEEFAPLLAEVQPFAGVAELLRDVRERGFTIVLASSGQAEHVERYLDLFDGKELADGWTTSADVQRTKPAPDLLEAALRKVGGTAGVVVGDSVWDFRAAAALGAPGYALRSGGFSVDELTAAGARDVFDSPDELHRRLDETLLAGRRSR
jgi:HAD superfamily hydrolase (TIGR01549 family)